MAPLLIFLLIVVLVILGIFTTWMFAEAVAEPDPDDRAHWVFMVKMFGPFGAIAYYFWRRDG